MKEGGRGREGKGGKEGGEGRDRESEHTSVLWVIVFVKCNVTYK